MDQIGRAYQDFLDGRGRDHLLRTLVDVAETTGRTLDAGGQRYVNFSSNDYLGLRHHPDLIARAQDWAARYGAGAGASRLVTGNLAPFTQVEDKIAALKGAEAALVMASGFQANASVLPALFDKGVLGAEPLVFTDRLNHASLHLGCAASGVRQIRFRHNDMDHLESLLQEHRGTRGEMPSFILTESVFSMDGDIAPLETLYELSKRYDSYLIVDEAHATGVLGFQGMGLAEQADITIGTFSKALGSFGAYITCSQTVKDYLINKCTGLIYATALPPTILGSIDAALDLTPHLDNERAALSLNAATFRECLQALGYDTGASATQIIPVMIGDAAAALALSDTLKRNGIWATAIRPPTVPQGSARLRFSLTSAHTRDDIDAALSVLSKARKDLAA